MEQKESFLDIVNSHLASENTQLPAFDTTVLGIQEELNNPNFDVRRIEKLIIKDQALTSDVLRMANSAFYRGLNKVETVRNAIVRIGAKEIANIALLATQKKNYQSKDPLIANLLSSLWRHAVCTAIGACWIAKEFDFQALANEAFFAGLLHDVGKLFIVSVIDDIKQSGEIAIDTSEALIHEVLHTLHPDQGYQLMQNWNLPETYAQVARDHHMESPDEKNYLLIIVRLANTACNKMGAGLRTDPDLVLAATDEATLLGVSEVDLARLEIKLEDAQELL